MPEVKFVVAAAQIAPRLGDLEANLALYEETVAEARGRGADLVVFPELSLTGYHLRDVVPSVALRLDGPEMKRLRAMSRKVSLVAGLVEETASFRFHNAAVFLDRGEIVAVHRKVYLPTYGMFDEQRYFARGERLLAFDSRFGRGAILICEDLWHPSTAYVAALDEALFVLCPSSSPLRGTAEGHEQDDNARTWELLNRFIASTFSLPVVYANRVGFEDGVGFWGGSEILDASGERRAKARYYEPDLVVGTVDHRQTRRRRVAVPLLRDEDVDLTIQELMRIRGWTTERSAGGSPDASRRLLPLAPGRRSASQSPSSKRRSRAVREKMTSTGRAEAANLGVGKKNPSPPPGERAKGKRR